MAKSGINNVISSLTEYKGIDLVFGGPPCQGFSVAGKMNPDDDRSKLIFTFLDVVEKLRPKAFVMENVKALAALEKWSAIREKYLKRAKSLGYVCTPMFLMLPNMEFPKKESVFSLLA